MKEFEKNTTSFFNLTEEIIYSIRTVCLCKNEAEERFKNETAAMAIAGAEALKKDSKVIYNPSTE